MASRLLRQYTHLVDGAKELEASGRMNTQVFIRNVAPIGVLFSFFARVEQLGGP